MGTSFATPKGPADDVFLVFLQLLHTSGGSLCSLWEGWHSQGLCCI